MTTAQIVQHLQPGGIESLVLTLLQQGSNAPNHTPSSHKKIVISLEGSKSAAIEAWPRLEPFSEQLFFLNKPAKASFNSVLALKKILNEQDVTAVHTHHIGPYLYGGIAAAMAGIDRHIHTEHDAWHLQNTKHSHIQRVLNTWLKPTLIADANNVAEQVYKTTGATSQVIYNGIDLNLFKPLKDAQALTHLRRFWGVPTDCFLVGSAGRLEPVKGHAYLIKALTQLPKNIHLVIAGNGSSATELRILTHELNLTERIHFLGHIDNTAQFYPMLDAFCLPSLNEGFPLAPLEAQACNINTIVTQVGGAAETLCPISGICVESHSATTLAGAIWQLSLRHQAFQVNNAAVTEKQPRDFIAEHFSVTTMAQAYHSLLCA